MRRSRTAIGLCVLCALALSGLVAQAASAQEAFTCAKGLGALDFGGGDKHCSSTKVTPGTGEYGHVPITVQTNFTVSNETTGGVTDVTKLKSVQSGVTLELQSTELSGTGTFKNSGGNTTGTGTVTYKGVTVTAPAGKGCKVKSEGGVAETVVTKSLSATNAGLTNEIKFTPTAGGSEPFAKFFVEGCSVTALNHEYTATGSVKGTTKGSTIGFLHTGTTTQGTLFLSGQAAGIEGTLTLKGENGNAVGFT